MVKIIKKKVLILAMQDKMLKEIQPEQSCPKCDADMCITGMFRNIFFIHTCFNCERTFINKNASKGIHKKEIIDENIRIGSTEFLDKSKKYE